MQTALIGDPGTTVVAELATELSRFAPEVCICNRKFLVFKVESVSAMRDSLPTCLWRSASA